MAHFGGCDHRYASPIRAAIQFPFRTGAVQGVMLDARLGVRCPSVHHVREPIIVSFPVMLNTATTVMSMSVSHHRAVPTSDQPLRQKGVSAAGVMTSAG